jgi:ParB-like chromosome segregation protein Spo0J
MERKLERQPVDRIKWVHRDQLKPNSYNPNAVFPAELKLLKISIMEDGWTQPIVINSVMEIVDGFHRWTISGDKQVYAMTDGRVPTVMLNEQTNEHQKMSTVRHNRARGTHGVLKMAEIVQSFIASGVSQQEIEERLQMESEEVIRLAQRVGIPKSKIIQDETFSKAWET